MNTSYHAVYRMQRYLPEIRCTAGWSGERLAFLLGVSRATISAWEDPAHGPLSMMQYLALRMILQDEIVRSNNMILLQVLNVLVEWDDVSFEDREVLAKKIRKIRVRTGRRAGVEEIKIRIRTALADLI